MVGFWWTETEVVGVWWTEIGGGCLVDRDCDGGCLVDRLQWWVFDRKTAVGGVWWTDCGGECLVDRIMVGVWWTDTGSRCLVDRDCGGGHLVDRHRWWVFRGQKPTKEWRWVLGWFGLSCLGQRLVCHMFGG